MALFVYANRYVLLEGRYQVGTEYYCREGRCHIKIGLRLFLKVEREVKRGVAFLFLAAPS